MKESSKERMAALLLQELFEQLAERENVKRMLGDMTSLPVDDVVNKLVGDVEQAIARRRVEAIGTLIEKKDVPEKNRQPENIQEPSSRVPTAPLTTIPPSPIPDQGIEASAAKPALVPLPSPAKEDPPVESREVPKPPSRVRVQDPPKDESSPNTATPFWGDIEHELRRPSEKSTPAPGKKEKLELPDEVVTSGEDIDRGEPEAAEQEDDAADVVANTSELRTAFAFSDDDTVYVHGVSLIPEGESPADEPFMLEEKGIDARSFAFAFDYEGLRFYLSKVLPNVMNISKTGVLLLGKQESLQLQGTHESVLNDLRVHDIILPFRFGTVSRGKDDLMGKIDDSIDELREGLETLRNTSWWVVNLHVLDARIAQLVGPDASLTARKGRMVERASYTKMPMPKKYDIKLLERMLNKEKRLAESIYEELRAGADRSDIDEIVGLGSGSSEEWKLILKASFEVKQQKAIKFFHTVTDLQYRHMMFDLMLSVTGDQEPVSFDAK